jgi:hypothetical protein
MYINFEEHHWEHQRALFSILSANRLALNLEKCMFAIAKLDFLGHCISAASAVVAVLPQHAITNGGWCIGTHVITNVRGCIGLPLVFGGL